MPDGKGHPSLKKSFLYALEGILLALRTERNIKLILILGFITIIAGLIAQLETWAWCLIILLTGLLAFAELINTALECLVDLACPEYHELAKKTKDIAAGAVLVLSITAVLIGIVLFGDVLLERLF